MSKKTGERKAGKTAPSAYYHASVATHPLFFVVALLFLLYFFPVHASGLHRSAELAWGIFLLAALPFALLYKSVRRREISINLDEQEKRNKFFAPWASIFAAAFLFYSFYNAKAHAALALSFCGAMLLLFFANRKSKISWHATGLSIISAASAYYYGAAALLLYATLVPLACFARWKLGAHTPFQLAAGAVAGVAIAVASFSLAY